jgi:hypothetical protein
MEGSINRVACILIALVLGAPAVWAADDVPTAGADERRQALLPDWLNFETSYRVRSVYVDPLDLSGEAVTDVFWTEQRMRMDWGIQLARIGGIHLQLDVLDGVLFGDNGEFPGDPQSFSGVAVSSRRPNRTAWSIGARSGRDPLDPDSYVPVLGGVEPVRVHHAWAEVFLPVGLLRVGRQPQSLGDGISAHDGGDYNRWGASSFSHTADRILFATKLDEAVRMMTAGPDYIPNVSIDEGLFFFLGYDWMVQDDIHASYDDLYALLGGLQWRAPRVTLAGAVWRDILASWTVMHRRSPEFDSEVWAFPMRLSGGVGPVEADFQFSMISGSTREISEGFAALSGRQPVNQELSAFGGHGRIDVEVGPVDLTLELDYATGDGDPRPSTPLTMFSFARDFNVGLLLFEHVLAFESARSAAVGIENLAQLDAGSFPLTEVATHGRFTNALALFPQVRWRILESDDHWLHMRFGVLMAWPDAGLVDPVLTTLQEDGLEITDDAVNFHGGDPGSYYGTEFDFQLEWRFREYFHWVGEAALLLPGDSLEDEHGNASPSFSFENRFVFAF